MAESLTRIVKLPSFEKINRYNVAIISLKNQLKTAISVDELTVIASKIIDLEQQIVVEKAIGCRELEKEKKDLINHVSKLRRNIRRAEDDLQRIDNYINLKISGEKEMLQTRIDLLSDEFSSAAREVQ